MNNTNTKRVFPIRFAKLRIGSKYSIFAEPSRDIRKSNDQNVYIKRAESYSENTSNPEHFIILYPEDLVVPLSRGS